MTRLTDFCLRCGCEKDSKDCLIANTLLSEEKIQGYECKMLRYMRNQARGERT